MPTLAARGIRAAQLGIVVNATLAAVKLVAGILGNTYALVADAVESAADIFGSLIVFFLIVEPHGLARLWQIGKEKLRLWPFPH